MRDRARDRWDGSSPDGLGDAELAERLTDALREEISREHVDVAGLLRETRLATRRVKVRRRALVAVAAAAAVAIPLGVETLRSGGPGLPGGITPAGGGSPTVSAPPAAADPPPPTATPRVPQSDDANAPAGAITVPPERQDDPRWQAYPIPDDVAFRASELPTRMPRMAAEEDSYRNGPTVDGQGCGTIPSKRWPLARRGWRWVAEEKSPQISVTLIVTGWNRSQDAFDSVVSNKGACAFPKDDAVLLQESDGYRWVAEMVGSGQFYGHAVQRVAGGMIVAVTVVHPDGTATAREVAEKLAAIAAQRLLISRRELAARKGAAPPSAGSNPLAGPPTPSP